MLASILKAAHRWLGLFTGFVAGSILAVMTVLVFLTVIYRYFLLSPISWGEEMARFLFIALSLFGAALAMRDGTHFAITMLTSRFPARVRAWVEIFVTLAITAVLVVVIREGTGLALLNRNQESPALGVPMSIPYVAVPCGGLLMLAFLWLNLAIARLGAPSPSTEDAAGGD